MSSKSAHIASYGGWYVATLLIAFLAFQPRSLKFGTFWEAGFPLRYAAWERGELTYFSFPAIVVDAVVPLGIAALLLRSYLREREAIIARERWSNRAESDRDVDALGTPTKPL